MHIFKPARGRPRKHEVREKKQSEEILRLRREIATEVIQEIFGMPAEVEELADLLRRLASKLEER